MLGDALTYLFQERHAPQILRSIDTRAYDRVLNRYQGAALEHRKTKYLDLERGVRVALRYLHRARLDAHPPSRVLDIGTGAGYFPYACRYFGHQAIGTEKRSEDFRSDGARQLDSMYLKLNELLMNERIRWTVRAFEEAPRFDERFDLVTAFSTWFDFDHEGEIRWDERPWKFLLTDLANNVLTERGRISVKLNLHKRNVAENDQRRERVLKFVTRTGGVVYRADRAKAGTQYSFLYPAVDALRNLT